MAARVARAPAEAPLIGLLHLAPDDPTENFIPRFRRDMKGYGREEGRNLRLLVVSAEGGGDRLPAAARELVARKADLIIVFGDPSIRAAQQATATVPIVGMTDDMLGSGLITSMARPGGITTGLSILATELDVKRLELLSEMVPQAKVIALLVSPDEPYTERIIGQMQEAVRAKRVDLRLLKARTESEIDTAFATLVQAQADGLVLGPIGFRPQIATLALRHAVPAIALPRDFPDVGGLISYGPRNTAAYHLKGILAGKILKGAKPADLPVQQPTKFELVINMRTAKVLGLTVPLPLLARADEVIE